jgi:hypothetical protein
MPKAKVSPYEATDETLLRHITGVGPSTLCVLANCGYKFRPGSTLGDFKSTTKSFADLQKALSDANISGGYTLPKLKMLWKSSGDGGGGGGGGTGKRGREEHDNQQQSKRQKVVDEAQEIDKENPDENFLLAPRHEGTVGDPEEEDEYTETPEIDALTRNAEVKAMPVGDVAPAVEMSVIPDVTLTISPDDKAINAPMEVLPSDPVPIVPGISLGPSVAQVRQVGPQTLEEKQGDIVTAEDLPSVNAAGGKDLGGDGFGSLVTEGRVGKDEPEGDDDETTTTSPGEEAGGGKRFSSKPLDVASIPKFDEKEEIKPFDLRGSSRHPFKQASLFRNHDMAVKVSKLITDTHDNNSRISDAATQAETNRDMSWYRYNASTQGVAMAQMPVGSTNYLARGPMVAEYQLFGPNPLLPCFGPAPYINEQLSGRFR